MNHPTTATRVIATAVAAVATVALATACVSPDADQSTSSSTPAQAQQWNPGDEPSESTTFSPPNLTTPTPKTTLPGGMRVDRSDAKAVAAAAVTIWFTWDTSTDQSRSDASARTAPLLSRSLADAVLADVSLRPDGQWRQWADREATITPKVTSQGNQGAPDSPTRKYFVFSVVQTAQTPAGQQIGDPTSTTAWVITEKTANGWEVTQIQEQQ
ncbi:hypothetical protein [Gordonia humi]|uniref:Lipoprotein n=1 Tax=Gordonia humi TaxID=686429 RepID=A0A840F871_9ACTN|nr:hypothetical protein [Gordonia humi]MBB4138086.1 hypothetical protein [Gordonia humi]